MRNRLVVSMVLIGSALASAQQTAGAHIPKGQVTTAFTWFQKSIDDWNSAYDSFLACTTAADTSFEKGLKAFGTTTDGVWFHATVDDLLAIHKEWKSETEHCQSLFFQRALEIKLRKLSDAIPDQAPSK